LATRHARENLAEVTRALGDGGKIRVGVHVRRGDFVPASSREAYRGRFNVALPLEWYQHVCGEIVRVCGGGVRFVLVSDEPSDEIRRLVDRFGMATTWHLEHTDVSDLLTLAESDVVVCSVSTYSVVAAWLSGGRYVWFRDHLQEHPGALSIWGHEETGGPTERNLAALARRPPGSVRPRGVPLDSSEPLPEWFATRPEADPATDLILYGAVPAAAG
ncbi:MAG TPA: alpha-1,2-fucosyltransferase, partial [Longimicrobium sp.]|nr:alpha-1,2-fucosyltransferase [Longimicrobium sp.]